MQALKTELEDLVFAILHPEEYEETRALIAAAKSPDDPLETIADNVTHTLRDAGISAEVLIRPRHFVSVHRVRRKRGELRGTDFDGCSSWSARTPTATPSSVNCTPASPR